MIFFLFACIQTSPSDTASPITPTDTSSPVIDTNEEEPHTDTQTEDTQSEIEGETFVLESEVTIAENGGLKFSTNLPMFSHDCLNIESPEINCSDEDGDELTDLWEDQTIEHLRPLLLLDEQEPFVDDPEAVFAQLARISPTGEWIDLFLVMAWSQDYGRCGISAHPGDSERVVIRLRVDEENNAVEFFSVYTAAHEGEITDAGKVWEENELNQLTLHQDSRSGNVRWVVFPSEGKHASFATIEHCESVSVLPCLDEDCAPDNVSDPNEWWLLGSAANVGEENIPRQDELSFIGFPGDYAWQDQDFCGGQGGTGCASPMREKFLQNPF